MNSETNHFMEKIITKIQGVTHATAVYGNNNKKNTLKKMLNSNFPANNVLHILLNN